MFFFLSHFDDDVLDFLNKIKPLLTNVFLRIGIVKSERNMRTLLAHLLPMLGSIRAIRCDNACVEFLERHFPGTLARARELLDLYADRDWIPTYLDWLSAPHDFGAQGPRFWKMNASSDDIISIVKAVRKVF